MIDMLQPDDFGPIEGFQPNEDYPRSWREFIGQERAKKQLKTIADSAAIRCAPADHLLLTCGQGGVGKTALALLFAQELGRTVHLLSGPVRLPDIRMVLMDAQHSDVIIYDEIHRVVEGGRRHGEWLLHLLQDGVLMTPLGPEAVPAVTMVGATTDVGRLPETIAGRFRRVQLTPYTDDEGAHIAALMAGRLFEGDLMPTDRDAQALARAANNNPREILQLLRTLRDMAVTRSIGRTEDGYDLHSLWEWQNLTPDGLDARAQAYLVVLLTSFKGGPVGAQSIADRLSEPGGLTQVEQLLMGKDLIARTQQGRMLTEAGLARARALRSAVAA